MRTRCTPGFSILELIVVIVMLLAVSIFVTACGQRYSQTAAKIKCAANLKQIGRAMMIYSNEERGQFPRGRYNPDTAASPTAYTKPNATNPIADDGPAPNDVTAAFWLLLRATDLTPGAFICPECPSAVPFEYPAGKDAKSFSNFPSQANLSYSLQNPYPTRDAIATGFKWNNVLPSSFVIAGDMNPGVAALTTVPANAPGKDLRTTNSPNHYFDGQNFLYADGHVEWQPSPWAGDTTSGAGGGADNVYTYAASNGAQRTTQTAGIIGPPADANDSVLLPVWDPKVPMPGTP